jgi:hypothetical protein
MTVEVADRWANLLTCPITLCDMSVESPVGAAYTDMFQHHPSLRVFYIKHFGIMVRGKRRPEERFR